MGIPSQHFQGQSHVTPQNGKPKPSLAELLNGLYVPAWQAAVAVSSNTVTLPAAGPVIAVDAVAAGTAGPKSQVNATVATLEVQVVYDAAGIPTLNFFAADAVTSIDVLQLALPTIPA